MWSCLWNLHHVLIILYGFKYFKRHYIVMPMTCTSYVNYLIWLSILTPLMHCIPKISQLRKSQNQLKKKLDNQYLCMYRLFYHRPAYVHVFGLSGSCKVETLNKASLFLSLSSFIKPLCFFLSLEGGSVWTRSLSQRAVKPNQPTYRLFHCHFVLDVENKDGIQLASTVLF